MHNCTEADLWARLASSPHFNLYTVTAEDPDPYASGQEVIAWLLQKCRESQRKEKQIKQFGYYKILVTSSIAKSPSMIDVNLYGNCLYLATCHPDHLLILVMPFHMSPDRSQ
jgi:hypothetical protein